ncbi:hypothetical protein BDV95DRAFT_611776 [Massariosphaeria phaeospora]|uniref:Uncharacterized protein n=1 Tax=Massariosphaeria phaeospora TaxID=100035 RepID=A0A7C8I2J0_9PLEO|nr:hypothetical protein BDV95DRAFT_611776 [Massariosphaeria phaeospora]
MESPVSRKIENPFCHVADSDLLAFTTTFHPAFPREVRDLVYTAILDKPTIDLLTSCTQPGIDDYPWHYTARTEADWPRYIRRGLVHSAVATELIEIFYEVYPNFQVSFPAQIANLLNEDFFKMGVTPAHGKISRLRVNGRLDDGHMDFVDIGKLREHFAPLLCGGQKWAKNRFELFVRFELSIRNEMKYSTIIARLAAKIKAVLAALQSVFRSVMARGGKSYLRFFVARQELAVIGHMADTQAQWVEAIKRLLDRESF